jgi:hypothetical protein
VQVGLDAGQEVDVAGYIVELEVVIGIVISSWASGAALLPGIGSGPSRQPANA